MEKIGVQMPEGKLEDMMHQAKQEWGFAGPRCGGGGHGGSTLGPWEAATALALQLLTTILKATKQRGR